ncbi:MAG: hypothetical protein A2270_03350 [Elusimicrobia bacterium RIFOXYA12_FULL_51_18]|nr:MAG: hypothetical protein A2270_03350 [Elusimicrobia bacterium RIFOXYA12_FULL_51_18]OGS31883.1 MAG: hypothetical protein A2218_06315 [Elusimicrobia bacterium RIFOXYA2_FULL_53_38]
MRYIIIILAFPLFFLSFYACSENLRRTAPPIEDVLHAGPLATILVYAGNVALGQSGPSAEGLKLDIGGTAVLSAQGRDVNNRPIKITPVWTASKPELISVTPSVGDIVAVKGLREGTAEIVAEYNGVKKTVNYIFIK